MSEVTVEIDARAALDLLRVMPDRIDRAMRGAMNDSLALLLREMKRYPPPPRDSGYTRTGNLGRNWDRTIEGSGMELVGTVGVNTNAAPYARYVQDREFQASIHQNRWTTVQDAAERYEDTINGFFQSRIEAELPR